MNKPSKTNPVNSKIRRITRPANVSTWRLRVVPIAVGIIASIGVWICATLANAQQPVLKISDLGSNQFLVEITNSVSTTNYTLYWTPVLADLNYPWVVLTNNAVGQSNFLVNAAGWESGYFRVILGTDFDGDGWPEWQDAQPQNSAVGILSVTIDSPISGSSFD